MLGIDEHPVPIRGYGNVGIFLRRIDIDKATAKSRRSNVIIFLSSLIFDA